MAKTLRSLARQTGLPRLEFQMLWQHILRVDRAWLIAHDTDPLSDAQCEVFEALVERRLAGEPMAYILGEREFMGHVFKVTPDVLIPRPDTELLVETALDCIRDATTPRVLDLGTGSGAIAISIALARPDAMVVATDVSAGALAVARENAQRLSANVTFLEGSWYDALMADMAFDLIVSNPPYIAQGDAHLQQGDLRHEPIAALSDGRDGLTHIRQIVSGAHRHLRPGGHLWVEHGWEQSSNLRKLLANAGFDCVHSRRDLAAIERITGGLYNGSFPLGSRAT